MSKSAYDLNNAKPAQKAALKKCGPREMSDEQKMPEQFMNTATRPPIHLIPNCVYLSSPTNSTTFTRCCRVAVDLNRNERCPKCGQKLES